MGNYNKAGSGIAKDNQSKGRLKLFFEILGVRIWKLFALNLIYLIACIPVVTVGPATAGMIKVLKNYSIDKNAYVWLDFIESYKKNFFKALVIGIVDLIAYFGLISGYFIYSTLALDPERTSTIYYVLFIVTISVGFMFTIMNYYIYLMLVSTDLSVKNIVKNAVALTFLSPKNNGIALLSNIILPIMMFLLIKLNLQFFIFLFIFPASFIGFIVCFCCYPVVQKYVINPYYESRGEQNPESPVIVNNEDEDVIFEDMGGKEKPVEIKKKSRKGKIIS
ncbi:MAG: DUF624 domain-containing protein [Oscillospiraceae bacterium]|nr:DUF624 domain-containing protein [Oscillospiraceae bacterium]